MNPPRPNARTSRSKTTDPSAEKPPRPDGHPPESSSAPSFEESLASLEQIVRELEQGELGLADSLARYEQGVGYLRECYRQLERAERRVAVLTGMSAEGDAETQPFDEDVMTLEEKADRRGARRSLNSSRSAASSDNLPGDGVDGSKGLF